MYQRALPHLKNLNDSSSDIESSTLISIDGLVMVTTLASNMEVDHIGAICAGMFNFGNHALGKCASGILDQVLISGQKNQIILIRHLS